MSVARRKKMTVFRYLEIVYKINLIRLFSVFLIIYYFITDIECIIDMNTPQFIHIANNLSQAECAKLITSLRYTSYELPASLEAKNTKNMTCIKLLIEYAEGKESWQGENKTHGVIEHRLRQLGRSDLADWLGNAVFHQLARDINDALLNPFAEDSPSALNTKLLKDKQAFVGAEWDIIDITLWMVLAGLLSSVVLSCCSLLCLSCRKKVTTNEQILSKQELSENENEF